MIEFINVSEVIEPSTYNKAKDYPQWRSAMQSGFDSIIRNETWDLIDLPPGHKSITAKWVSKIKKGHEGTPPIYKDRLVARGIEEQEGIDYKETFVLVIKWRTLRLVVSKAASKQWKTLQLDVKPAFLYSLLKEIMLIE